MAADFNVTVEQENGFEASFHPESAYEDDHETDYFSLIDCSSPPPPPSPPPSPPPPLPQLGALRPLSLGRLSQRNIQKALQFELVQVIERADLSALHQLIDKGTDLNCIIMFNKTPLTYAIEKGNFTMAITMVYSGANVNHAEPCGNAQQPLHIAVKVGSCHMIEFLLNNAADINGKNRCGLTPLMLSCYLGQEEAVKLLYAHGADLNAEDHIGKTALHRAAEGQHVAVVEFLLTKGADINAVDKFGRNALYHSIVFRHVNMVQLLLQSGISADCSDMFCQSPLQVAVQGHNKQNMKAVLATSVDYHTRRKMIPSTELRKLLLNGESESTMKADFQILQLLVNAGVVPDFSRLGNHICHLPTRMDDDDWKLVFWYYLSLCDCSGSQACLSVMASRVSYLTLEAWKQERESLQWLCRAVVRRHFCKMQVCDIHNMVDKLPIPAALKGFLNLSDFFRKYPQFVPLQAAGD